MTKKFIELYWIKADWFAEEKYNPLNTIKNDTIIKKKNKEQWLISRTKKKKWSMHYYNLFIFLKGSIIILTVESDYIIL